jgi:murein L,D-transpeptidase YcbB/YkuD
MSKRQQSLRMWLASCLLAGGIVPGWVQATVPVLPVTSPAQTGVQQSISNLQEALPKNVKPLYLSELTSLYAANHMQPIWQDRVAVEAFQQQLAEMALSGIQPQFNQWAIWLTDPAVKGMARDIVLSDAMLGYLQFVNGVEAHGEVWLYGDESYKMKMATPSAALVSQWQTAIHKGMEQQFIAKLAPQHPLYAKMHDALKLLLADNKPWPQIVNTTSLKPGQSSPDVPSVREILKRTGMLNPVVTTTAGKGKIDQDDVSKNTQGIVDDDLSVDELSDKTSSSTAATTAAQAVPDPATVDLYQPDLVEAVKRFQKWQGLEPDGIVGGRTRDWLNSTPGMRASLLALNIQRLRMLPASVDTGIMVNIANYHLIYYLNGNEVLSSRVIVGRPSRKTPLMSSVLNNVVLNPPWNVPTDLVRKDILPKAMSDASYFQKHGYTLLSGWDSNASVIDPATLNWSDPSVRNFPYHIRQLPGAQNSLGRYKFNMPSSDAIYLHDTPNHGLFKKDIRALSSGCVRINKAAELAAMLLQDAGWNDARITSVLKAGNTAYVPIRHSIPVKLFYLTAWVSDDGKPQFRTDIYNYDSPVTTGYQIYPQAEILLQ